jgi:protein translocase SecG subunit
LGILLLALVYLSSIVLIVLVAAQTTKSEGFSGAIGGGAQTTIKYLPGSEDMLTRYTTYVAIFWMACCLLWFVAQSTGH